MVCSQKLHNRCASDESQKGLMPLSEVYRPSWFQIFLGQLTKGSSGQEIHFLREVSATLHGRVHKSARLDPVVRQLNPVNTLVPIAELVLLSPICACLRLISSKKSTTYFVHVNLLDLITLTTRIRFYWKSDTQCTLYGKRNLCIINLHVSKWRYPQVKHNTDENGYWDYI